MTLEMQIAAGCVVIIFGTGVSLIGLIYKTVMQVQLQLAVVVERTTHIIQSFNNQGEQIKELKTKIERIEHERRSMAVTSSL